MVGSTVSRVDVLEDLAYSGRGAAKFIGIGGDDVHRGAQRLPALERDGHHEPPLVTVPLLLLPVVGACVDCRVSLLVVELELDVVDVVVFRAVPEAFDDDLPAYEAAAT